MTNLEWLNEIGMIAENEVWTKMSDLKGQIGVNLVIALRDDDFKKYSEKGFGWFLEEHKEPIKLKRWEKDLLASQTTDRKKFEDVYSLMKMKSLGYFKNVKDETMRLYDILENCKIEEEKGEEK